VKKIEVVVVKNPKTNKWEEPKFVEVTPKRARNYIRSVVPKGYRLREYCENCGRIFGKLRTIENPDGYTFEKPVMFKTWFVCPSCKVDLEKEIETGKITGIPNLNDL